MTTPLFLRSDSENDPIPDRPARAKRKSGAVGDGLGFSPPDSNTGGKIEKDTPMNGPPSWNLQGEAKHGYRFWRAPFGPQTEWQLVYREAFEPLETANPKSADVDWLHIVFRLENTNRNVEQMDSVFRKTLGFGISKELPYGRFNYSRQLVLEDQKTLFLLGGENQRNTAMIAIPGSAIQYMDLEKLRVLGEEKLGGWITRVDLCADFFGGEYTFDKAVRDYHAGLYNSGGRQPSNRYIGPLGEICDKSEGRTLYVGKRENGKMIRIYEKGKQLGITTGSLVNWVRVELELRGSSPETVKGRVIPWEILTRPGAYLAGCCTALSFISETYNRVKTISIKVGTSLKKSIENCQRIYGRVINALNDMGMAPSRIVRLLRRDGFPDYYEKKEYTRNSIEPEKILSWAKEIFGGDFVEEPAQG